MKEESQSKKTKEPKKVKEPKQEKAVEKQTSTNCTDLRCPIHGQISIRGRNFVGTITKKIFQKTAHIEFGTTKFDKKYKRYEKGRTKIQAHAPECMQLKMGDVVKIEETRPLSKTKNFVVTQKIR